MQTTPLAKAITTLEGQIVAVSNVVLAAGAVDHLLPAKWAGVLAVVQNVALVAQRLVLKAKASPAVTAVVDSPAPLKQIVADVKAVAPGWVPPPDAALDYSDIPGD